MLKSVKFKIILSSAACILIVGVFSNVYLYRYLTAIITEKVDYIDRLNLQTVQTRLNLGLEEFVSLGSLCAYDLEIARGMRNPQMQTPAEKRSVLQAQEVMQRYLSAYPGIEPYVSRFIAFNEQGVRAQAVTREYNKTTDIEHVMNSATFQLLSRDSRKYTVTMAPSAIDNKDVFIFLSRIFEIPASIQRGWIYIELDSAFIVDMLSPYAKGSLFVAGRDGSIFPQGYAGLPVLSERDFPSAGNTFAEGGRIYKIQSTPLGYADLTLYSRADVTFLSADANAILYTTVVVVITSLAAALLLAVLLSNIIAKPLNRLTSRLRRISENEFSRDPSIEKGSGEIAEMGRVVNEMTESITALLRETEEMHLQRKNAEITLLQSQVNPHFLYNTLDSVRWMAVIQKNPGIEKTVRSLSNLLKNLAKNVDDKITLHEELSLLRDYMDTQSVRFMDMLELEDRVPAELRACRIVKFTLQPLVENSIFHGIEPSGECGRITVDAREDGEYLLVFVEDNGVGMSAERLRTITDSPSNPHPKGMAGIGVANVDSRLKLIYGETCGLSYESEPGRFTRVTVRIKREGSNVQDTAGGR